MQSTRRHDSMDILILTTKTFLNSQRHTSTFFPQALLDGFSKLQLRAKGKAQVGTRSDGESRSRSLSRTHRIAKPCFLQRFWRLFSKNVFLQCSQTFRWNADRNDVFSKLPQLSVTYTHFFKNISFYGKDDRLFYMIFTMFLKMWYIGLPFLDELYGFYNALDTL